MRARPAVRRDVSTATPVPPAEPPATSLSRAWTRACSLAWSKPRPGGWSGAWRGWVGGGLAVAAAAATAGCGGGSPAARPTPTAPASASDAAPLDASAALAALAAAAQDRKFTALYVLDTAGRPERTVVVTMANDGGWRLDVPGGALGGTADVALVQIEAGVFQCALPSDRRPAPSTCVKVADQGKKVPRRYDPAVQHLFSDWLEVFTDRAAPLAVSPARPLDGAGGACFAVESISAALRAPVDVGIYCFADDGLPTAARTDFGTLRLSGAAAPAPPSVDLPGPVVAGDPLGVAAPPKPTAPATPTTTPTATTGPNGAAGAGALPRIRA